MAEFANVTEFVNAGYWLASTDDRLPAANIDATLFTHLFAGYAQLNSGTYQVTVDPSQLILIDQFSSTVKLSNPEVKTLLSIAADAAVFAAMAADPTNRDAFIKSSIAAARGGGFDGLDLQWLYPSSQDEMGNFKTLIHSWHQAVVDDATRVSLPQLLLVATVSNLPYLQKNVEYPADAINQKLDWVNLLSYDFYTPDSSKAATGPSSAFHNPKANALSANFGIRSWAQSLHNLPHKKIVFGIPFHGWAWKLFNSHQHALFAKADGAATGEYIGPHGQIFYSDVQKFIEDNQAGVEDKDKSYLVAYAYYETTWITYESEYTIADKIALAKADKVLGYFAFNIAADDASNTLANAAKSNW